MHRQAQARRIGIGQDGADPIEVCRLGAGDLHVCGQNQIGCGRRRSRQEGVDWPIRRHGDHLTALRIQVSALPVQTRLDAHVAAACHTLPVEAAIARQPDPAVAPVGRGHQGLGIVAHPDRSPTAHQAHGTPSPALFAGVGDVQVTTGVGRHQACAAGVHVSRDPVGVVFGFACLVAPGDRAIALELPDVEAAADRAIGLGTHRAQDRLTVATEGQGAPIRTAERQLGPRCTSGIEDAQVTGRVALAPVKDVIEVPLTTGLISGQQAAVIEHQRFRVIVIGCALTQHPRCAAIGRQSHIAVTRHGGNALPVVSHRHRVKAQPFRDVRRRPGLPLIAREVNPHLIRVHTGHGHQQTLRGRHVAPVQPFSRRAHDLDHSTGARRPIALLNADMQGLRVHCGGKGVRQHTVREVAIQICHRAGKTQL